MSQPAPHCILLLAASPLDLVRLQLDKEFKAIKKELRGTPQRDSFDVRNQGALQPDDLQDLILTYRPKIVHFSGHGSGEAGLLLENNYSRAQPVSTVAIASLFELMANDVDCVVLNACFSRVQAEAINQYIPYVVGMHYDIGDRVAIQFATGFYRALGHGESYESACDLGKNAIQLQSSGAASQSEHLTPIFLHNPRLTVAQGAAPGDDDPTRPDVLLLSPKRLADLPPLETPEGQVPLGSPLYVERPPIESDCDDEVIKPGALIRIKAPRQMGKSSLLARILHHSEIQGDRTVSLSFQEAEGECFGNLETFLQWFCASITDELELSDEIDTHWKKRLGSVKNSTNYMTNYLLAAISEPIVLGLDEVDRVFEHFQIAKDFFGMLRVWHEKGKNPGPWQNLRLVITHSKEVYVPLDINQSPFNVGLPIDLPMFDQPQVAALAQTHGLTLDPKTIDILYHFLGGNPYLVRVALHALAKPRLPWPPLWQKFMAIAPTEAGPYGDHLTRHLQNLYAEPTLKSAMKVVIQARQPVSIGATEAFKLRSMGLVRFVGNQVEPLCDLYRQYFQSRLGGGL